MEQTELNLNSVSKEQLLIYLADKSKEVKTSERKLKKVEERYMTIFKENKSLKKALDNFYARTKHWMTAESIEIPAEDSEKLSSFESICTRMVSKIDEIIKGLREKEAALQQQLSDEKERSSSGVTSEIYRLKQQIYSKDDQITQLQDRLSEIETANFDSLLNDLKKISTKKEINVDEKIKESEKTNEILRLKNEIKVLKEALSEKEPAPHRTHSLKDVGNQETHKYGAKNEKAVQTEQLDANGFAKQGQHLNTSQESRESLSTNTGVAIDVMSKTEEQNLRQYMKDLLSKYFMYESQGLENEKMLIMNVIFDVLRFNYDEKIRVEKVIQKKGKFLGLFKA